MFSLSSQGIAAKISIAPQLLDEAEQQGGVMAKQRLLAWQALINDNQGEDELVKLRLTNDFFNQIRYAPDRDEWGKRNYWATPVDFLSKGAGDCEDFALAKYYTLKKLGVPVSKMRLTYVKALRLNQAHMVLSFYDDPNDEPMILDNIKTMILYSSERQDLKPVYSFNDDALWITKSINKKNSAKKVGTSNRMNLWSDWIERMNNQGLE